MNMKRIAVIAIAVVAASATAATAGTKYATNLVSNSTSYPETPPTLSPKSKIALSDKGIIQIALAGVVDGGGLLVTTSTVFNDSLKDMTAGADLDGSEYIVIIKIYLPAITGIVPSGYVEVPVPVDLKGGKGKTKLNVAGLLVNLGATAGRGLEITGAEVWGPLGGATEASNCEAIINGSFQSSLGGPDPSCRGTGTQFGMSGLYIPPPAP